MLYLLISIMSLATGFLLDLCFGDPHWLPHPVRLIGKLILFLERILYRSNSKQTTQRLSGAILVFLVCSISTTVPLAILLAAHQIHPVLHYVLASLFCYQILAVKALKRESTQVYAQLKQNNLPAARTALSRIVGRDTAQLTPKQIAKAAVETVAENTCDGVIAPLFFLLLGGAPLGFFYKAANTMDSMLGYRNDRYRNFGTPAARLDDVLNYLPARICARLMLLAVWACGFDSKAAHAVYRRDHRNHASPNSAHAEAVCAGALHIQLAGDAYYFGKLHHKPTIGNNDRSIQAEDICRANRLLYVTASFGIVFALLIKISLFLFLRF
mgnify:CR=1 FL=1